MKRWTILIGILVVIFIGGYFGLTCYAVKMVQPYLQKAIGSGFTVAELSPKITCLSARGVRYQDPRSKQICFQIEEVRIYPSLLSLFKKSLCLKEVRLIQPTFFFSRSQEGEMGYPWMRMKREKGEGSPEKDFTRNEERKKEASIPVQIDRILILKGDIDFEDQKVGTPPARIKFEALEIEIGKIRYPFSTSRTFIELKGRVIGKHREGTVKAIGWIDLKTMELQISLRGQEVELDTFKPYYRKRVSAEILSGFMNLDSRIVIRDKIMEISGELDLTDFRVQNGEGTFFWIPAEELIPLLEQRKGEIKIPFHVNGDLKDPRFSPQEALLVRIGFSLLDALRFPVKKGWGPA